MPWELEDIYGARYRLPASIAPTQLHVGGRPRVRFVRAYGSDDWYRTLDGLREPGVYTLAGILQTDRDEAGIQTLLDALRAAVATAEALVQVSNDEGDVATLWLLGALPVTTTPDGIDGSLLNVTIPLIPEGEWEVSDSA